MVKLMVSVIGTSSDDASEAARVREGIAQAAAILGLVGTMTHNEGAKVAIQFSGTFRLPEPKRP